MNATTAAATIVSIVFLLVFGGGLAVMTLREVNGYRRLGLLVRYYRLWFCAQSQKRSRAERSQCQEALAQLGQQLPTALHHASARYAQQYQRQYRTRYQPSIQPSVPLLPAAVSTPLAMQPTHAHAYVAPDERLEAHPITNPRLVAIARHRAPEGISPALREACQGASRDHERRLESVESQEQ